MAFDHHPGLAALHQVITGGAAKPAPIEQSMVKEAEKKAEIEEITKEVQDDARLARPQWKGFGS